MESAIGHTQATALKGLRFETLEAAQEHLDRWDERWADERIHGRTKRQVAQMYEEERPHLLPLPVVPFRYFQHGERTVHLDGHVELNGPYDAAPPGMIARVVPVQWDEHIVRIVDPKTRLLCVSTLYSCQGATEPPSKTNPAKTPKTTEQLLARAMHAGRDIGLVCNEIHSNGGETSVRLILGVFSLTKRFGPATANAACGVALAMGVPTYRFVRTYLEKHPSPHVTLKQIDPLIRS